MLILVKQQHHQFDNQILEDDPTFDFLYNLDEILAEDMTDEEANEDLPDIVFGDVNEDGQVNVLDAVAIINFVIGNSEFTNAEMQLADYNGDNLVNVLDVVAIIGDIVEA